MSEPRLNILRLGGTISPGRYFTTGCLLTLLKMLIDGFVATRLFRKPWSPLMYAITGEIGGLFSLDRDEQKFYTAMLALALPFILIGVSLTVRRLRDAGWPLWLVALFFLPIPINLVFFVVLSLAPSRAGAATGGLEDVIDAPTAYASKLRDDDPRFDFTRALAAILFPMAIGGAVVYFGTHVLNDYGWSLFVGSVRLCFR